MADEYEEPIGGGLSAAQATASCAAFDALVKPPAAAGARKAYERDRSLARAAPMRRRIFDLILFGHEMDMLRLHMRTLEQVVDAFLVAEASTCFQTATKKRPLLSDALASGAWPTALAAKTVVKVVTLADGLAAGCRDLHGGGSLGRHTGRRYSGRIL